MSRQWGHPSDTYGEADEARVRQRIPHVAGETVDQVILLAVRFVGDNDDVPARRKLNKQQGHPERWPCDARNGCVWGEPHVAP